VYELALTIEPDGDGWKGTGRLKSDGTLCLFSEVAGPEGKMRGFLDRMAASVIEGAEVTSFNPEVFDRALVSAVFGFRVEKSEVDQYGRIHLVIGDPEGGVMSKLPADLHIYSGSRTSPVILPAGMTQRVSIRLKEGGKDVIYLPLKRDLDNDAGAFSLDVTKKNGWVTVDRKLELKKAYVDPGGWPALRALLLEESDPGNRTIYMK
jgi:hypothetical protein